MESELGMKPGLSMSNLVSLRHVKSLHKLSIIGSLACLAFGLLLTGCGGQGGGPGDKDPEIIAVNASSSTGTLTYFFNDTAKGGSLAPNTKSALFTVPILEDSAGGYDVSLEDSDRTNFWENQQINLLKNTSTILVAIGIKNPPSGDELKRLRFVITSPDRNPPVGSRARLVIVHAFTRKTGFGTPTLSLMDNKDTPLFQSNNMNFGDFTTLEVDSGTYTGTNHWIAKNTDTDNVWAENLNQTLKAGSIYFVIVGGTEDPSGTTKAPIVFLEIPANS